MKRLLPLLFVPTLLAAQPRISQVLVFPGGAEVQRVQTVPAGAIEAVFACVPARILLDSIKAQGSAELRVGEISVQTQPSVEVPACRANPSLEAQIRQLEDQRAVLKGEREALDLLLGYLRQSGDAKQPANAATAESLRKQALEAFKQQHALQRRDEALELALKPLLAQRDQAQGGVDRWHRIAVRVSGSGELTLTTRTPHAGWQPVYRADLIGAESRIQLERRAEVQQTSGESWRDVSLSLSTRQPSRVMALADPQPWRLSKVDVQGYFPPPMEFKPAPAPAPMAKHAASRVGAAAPAVDADLPSFQTDFDLQFSVPGSVTLASGSERRSFTLERLSWPAEVVTQVQPRQQAQAYLMATVKRPEGFFPTGKLLLSRDGDFIGETQLNVSSEAEQRLFFGPDDRIRVRVEPEQRDAANGGFIGSRRVMALKRAYVLENTSAKALTVQVVEAAPHAQHEDIQVEARFDPAPKENRWRELDGVRLWSLQLAPKQSQRLRADYQLSAPKDMVVAGWP